MKKMKSFIKEVVARVAGDQAEVVAQKNYRKATSAVKSQIAALQAKEVDDEAAVEQANENLENAKFPVTPITDNKTYVSSIKRYQDNVDAAAQALEDTRSSIAYFQALLEDFDAEVEK